MRYGPYVTDQFRVQRVMSTDRKGAKPGDLRGTADERNSQSIQDGKALGLTVPQSYSCARG